MVHAVLAATGSKNVAIELKEVLVIESLLITRIVEPT